MSTSTSSLSLQDLRAFVETKYRLPRLDDPRPPWTYRGFLLPYVIELHHMHPQITDRWRYYFRIVEYGLIPDPIPQVSFCHSPDRTTYRVLECWIRLIEETSSAGIVISLISQLDGVGPRSIR